MAGTRRKFSLIILPAQEKWSGDGAGIKAITGGDAVAIDPKYRDAYSTHIPAVILAVNNLHTFQRRRRVAPSGSPYVP